MTAFAIDDRVEGGEIPADYDTGTVVEVDGDEVTVAWDSGVTTTQGSAVLRVEGVRPVRRAVEVTP